ncbi:MAG: hypothetical protein AAGF12_26170 [Myxococcota bacterium]
MKWFPLVGLLVAWVGGEAQAQDAAVGVGARASNFEAGGEFDVRLRWDRGYQLGLTLRGARTFETFVGGFAEDDGASFEAIAHGILPLAQRDGFEVGLRTGLGVRQLLVDEAQGPDDSATRWSLDTGPIVALHLGEAFTLRLGWTLLFELELTPTTDVADLGQRITIGGLVSLGGGVSVYADVGALGTFGFSGDNGKFIFDGSLGLRWVFGGNPNWRLF